MSGNEAVELIELARQEGVELWTEAGELRYRARPGTLAPALRERLTAHREEIITLLQKPSRPQLRVVGGGLSFCPTCPCCGVADYMPIGSGWRRCWSCAEHWGPAEVPDPGDPPHLARIRVQLGILARRGRKGGAA